MQRGKIRDPVAIAGQPGQRHALKRPETAYLVAAAVNDAVRQVEKTTEEKMSGLTAGMGLPGGFKLPF